MRSLKWIISNIKPYQEIRVDMEYVETLRVINNAFYIKIPIKFDNTTLSSRKIWSDVVRVNAIINHPIGKKIIVNVYCI